MINKKDFILRPYRSPSKQGVTKVTKVAGKPFDRKKLYVKKGNDMKLDNISQEDYDHYYHKWLYYYGGAGDVVDLKTFVQDYDSDKWGEIDVYSQDICPCIMCVMGQ